MWICYFVKGACSLCYLVFIVSSNLLVFNFFFSLATVSYSVVHAILLFGLFSTKLFAFWIVVSAMALLLGWLWCLILSGLFYIFCCLVSCSSAGFVGLYALFCCCLLLLCRSALLGGFDAAICSLSCIAGLLACELFPATGVSCQ